MEEKPKMYQNKIDKVFHNNREVYASLDHNYNGNVTYIRKKIEQIIDSNSFIYSKLVHIVIDNKTITRKIIGIDNNSLITIDNEYIPLENIQDIYI